MSTQTVNRELNIFIKSGEAEKVYDKLIAKEKTLNEEIGKTTDPKRLKVLQGELAKLSEPIERAAKKMRGELAPAAKDLQAVIAKLGQQLSHMSASDEGYSKVLKQFAQAKVELAGIQAEVKKVEKAQQDVSNTNPFGRVLDYAKGAFLGGGLLGIVQAGIGNITSFISDAFDEAFSAEEAGARLKATLDNLGRSDAFDRISAKADELAEKFKYLDNDDVTGVFEKLINYGKLTENQMNELLPVIINFAAKQRISIEEASTAIVGALEGNGKALKQYGINIKEGGDSAERLGIVMTTLKEKVEGAAEAFQGTTAGKIAVMRQEFANLKEEVGNRLIPIFNGALSIINGFVKSVISLVTPTKSATEEFNDLGKNVLNLEQNISPLLTRYDQLKEKTSLSKKEQAEMKSIVEQVTAVMPGAVTQFDQYGRAVAISTDRVRDFIATEKARLKVVNASALKENENALSDLQTELDKYEKRVQQISQTGTFNAYDKRNDGSLFIRKANQQEIAETQAKYQELLEKRKGYQAEVERLNGTSLQKQLDAQAEAEKKNQNKILGTGNTSPGTTDSTGKNKTDKAKDDQKKLYEDLLKLKQEYIASLQTEDQQEIQKLVEKYNEMRKLAHGDKELLQKLEEQFQIDVEGIRQKYRAKDAEAMARAQDDRTKALEKARENELKAIAAAEEKLAKQLADQVDKLQRSDKAGLELDRIKAHGKQRLDLELQLLDVEEKQALAKKGITENEKLLIEEQFRQKRKEMEDQFLQAQVATFLNFAQQMVGIISTLDGAKTASENAELERDKKLNDKKKANYEKQVKSGVLTRMDADRKIAELDKKAEEKEKATRLRQFKRDQRMQIVQALIGGAQAIVSTLAAKPGPLDILSLGAFRAINIGLAVATTAAQIAAISSQKPPEFARGGRTRGQSHAQGGMAVVDSFGRKQAEVEGGEAIINKHSMSDRNRYTITGTPSQIASGINSLHGGVAWESGATLVPQWRTASPSRMNFSGIKRRFADGGVVGGVNASADASAAMMADLANSIDNLNSALANGIWAKVLLSEFNQQQARLDAIKKDTVLK